MYLWGKDERVLPKRSLINPWAKEVESPSASKEESVTNSK